MQLDIEQLEVDNLIVETSNKFLKKIYIIDDEHIFRPSLLLKNVNTIESLPKRNTNNKLEAYVHTIKNFDKKEIFLNKIKKLEDSIKSTLCVNMKSCINNSGVSFYSDKILDKIPNGSDILVNISHVQICENYALFYMKIFETL